jgi:hypothetical protein
MKQDKIATLLDVDPKTLRAHCRKELDTALAQTEADVGATLVQKAKEGDLGSRVPKVIDVTPQPEQDDGDGVLE